MSCGAGDGGRTLERGVTGRPRSRMVTRNGLVLKETTGGALHDNCHWFPHCMSGGFFIWKCVACKMPCVSVRSFKLEERLDGKEAGWTFCLTGLEKAEELYGLM